MNQHRPNTLRATLTIGEVAKRAGVATSALRFYEARGLIRSTRNTSGHRRYARDTLRLVAVIKVAQRIGIPLEEIAEALATLPERRTPNASDWRRLSDVWRSHLDERIDKLCKLRDQLDDCIGCGCLSLKSCPLRNPSDVAAEVGPGARLFDRHNDKAKPSVRHR